MKPVPGTGRTVWPVPIFPYHPLSENPMTDPHADHTPPLPAGGPEQGPVPLEQALAAFEQEDFTLSPAQRQALASALLSLAQETTNLSVAIGSLARLLLLAEAAERPAPRPPESEQGNPPPAP